MKIALIGYGKMGKMVEQAAQQRGHSISCIIDPKQPHRTITPATIGNADICIDFSHPEYALKNIQQVAALKKPLVMGTTGWYTHLVEVKKIISQAHIGFLYAPNFSLGVALFLRMIENAAQLIAPFDTYDVSGLEIHHNQKLDSPSGTAKAISERVASNMPQKREGVDFACMRIGAVPGTHTIVFDSPVDTITLTHTARNREGFAYGAVQAAEWLESKTGFFTIDDLLRGIYAKA